MGKWSERIFFEVRFTDDNWIDETVSISLDVREMLFASTIRYHFLPVKMADTTNTKPTHADKDMNKKVFSHTVDGSVHCL
jgi:hypothetical protein